MAEFSWKELPDINAVADALKLQALLKTRLRIAKLQLDMYQAEMSRTKPRDATVKLIGVDEHTKAKLQALFDVVCQIEDELGQVEADITFYNYRKDAAKIMSYQGRV